MGWSELLLIGVVTLIVVGPKDLPVLFKTLGQWTARVRKMSREFTQAMHDAADASGAADLTKDLKNITNPKAMGLDALNKAVDFDADDPFGEDEADLADADTEPKKPLGPHTQKLSEERAEAARKIREATAAKAEARLAKEAAEAEAAKTDEPGDDTPEPSESKA